MYIKPLDDATGNTVRSLVDWYAKSAGCPDSRLHEVYQALHHLSVPNSREKLMKDVYMVLEVMGIMGKEDE